MPQYPLATDYDDLVSKLTLPPVEWVPLDRLIQTWAGFAHSTLSQAGLEATSATFAALALETRARQSYADAMRERTYLSWSPRGENLATDTLAALSDACARWIEAAERLSHVQAVQDEEAVLKVPEVGVAVARHVQYLCALFLRLVQEFETALGCPLHEEVA